VDGEDGQERVTHRRSAVALVAAAFFAVLAVRCGGGGTTTGDDVAQRVGQTIQQPGMVYHAVASDGAEVWIDASDQLYRKADAPTRGTLVSVGQGWLQTVYSPVQNAVAQNDKTPPGPATPRINNPAVSWTEALAALGFGNELQMIDKETADGIEVWVLQARTPIVDSNGNVSGSLIGRVEVDVGTNLPHAFEGRQTSVDGTTPTPDAYGLNPNHRTVYTTSEMIPRGSLAADFFDPSNVSAQVQTPAGNLQKLRAIGLAPLWFGEQYLGPGGLLQLPVSNSVTATASAKRGDIHYTLILPTSATKALEETDAVIIRLAADASTFTAPTITQFGGVLPEQKDTVTVSGQPAILFTSTLTPNDLPCPKGATCSPSDAAMYRRLIFAVGKTNVQLEASARIDSVGQDANGYNTRDGIIALAEALKEAPAATPTPSVSPSG
jgi:hypothetical protein